MILAAALVLAHVIHTALGIPVEAAEQCLICLANERSLHAR